MPDTNNQPEPKLYGALLKDAERIGYTMSCDVATGSLLKVLAASKPNGTCLELGTGVGISTAWILDGLDQHSTLLTVEYDESLHAIAKQHLQSDRRIRFYTGDGAELIRCLTKNRYDYIFADTWPGKFFLLDETLQLLKHGGFYIADDLLQQEDWPDDHVKQVTGLLNQLENRTDIHLSRLVWSTGILIAVKK